MNVHKMFILLLISFPVWNNDEYDDYFYVSTWADYGAQIFGQIPILMVHEDILEEWLTLKSVDLEFTQTPNTPYYRLGHIQSVDDYLKKTVDLSLFLPPHCPLTQSENIKSSQGLQVASLPFIFQMCQPLTWYKLMPQCFSLSQVLLVCASGEP